MNKNVVNKSICNSFNPFHPSSLIPHPFSHPPATAGGTDSKLRALVFALLCIVLSLSFSCKPKQAATQQRYELKGKVVSVDKSHHEITIAHDEIKGYMPAMVMPYKLRDEQMLDILQPNDQISATLVVSNESSWLEDVVSSRASADNSYNELSQGMLEARPGDVLPDFKLVNQDGKPVHLHQYQGKILLLTFIYTRCPLPDYCTRMTTNFHAVDQELQRDAELYNRTHLLSISFDPDYDTPQVLRSYGSSHTEQYRNETFKHWEFLTGKTDEIKSIAQFFGLTYFPDEGQIVHSLRTALIGTDGKVVKIYRGNEWKPEDIVNDVRTLSQGQQPS
ncbi:MAG TPA: SCO family protein [Pyrinomonadaceae bacterium]|nr:SCO family protein [Pyrinomonadaceae bacterium]